MPTPKEIHAAYKEGEEAVVELFGQVGAQMKELANQLEKQAEALNSMFELENKHILKCQGFPMSAIVQLIEIKR